MWVLMSDFSLHFAVFARIEEEPRDQGLAYYGHTFKFCALCSWVKRLLTQWFPGRVSCRALICMSLPTVRVFCASESHRASHCSVTSFTLMFNCGCTVLLLLTALIPLHKVASLFPSFYPLNSCLSATDLLACLLCQTQEKSQSVFPFTWHLSLIPIPTPSLAFCILLCLF